MVLQHRHQRQLLLSFLTVSPSPSFALRCRLRRAAGAAAVTVPQRTVRRVVQAAEECNCKLVQSASWCTTLQRCCSDRGGEHTVLCR